MVWAIILTFLALLIGLAGVVLPFLPGVPIAWLGLFGFGYYTHFTDVSVRALWIFGGLTILSFLIDFLGPIFATKMQHASGYGTKGAFLGTILGVAVLGPIGVAVGPFIGAFLGELLAGASAEQAYRAAFGALTGFLIGSAAKAAIVAAMIAYLAVVLLF